MVRYVVQNTFVHHIVEEAEEEPLKTKRSTSLPASQRFGDADDASSRKGPYCVEMDGSTDTCSTMEVDSMHRGSWTPSSPEEDIPQQASGECPGVFSATCTWTPAMMPVFIVTPATTSDLPPPTNSVVATEASANQAMLNAAAKPWTPDEATVKLSRASQKEDGVLCRKVFKVMEGIKSSLAAEATSRGIKTVHVTEDQFGHVVNIGIKAGDIEREQDILMLAKSAITTSVRKTPSLHFLPPCLSTCDPFVYLPTGMAVTVVSVKDDQQVCWDMLHHGFCNFGKLCHWKHPKSQKRITVNIEPVEEAFAYQ